MLSYGMDLLPLRVFVACAFIFGQTGIAGAGITAGFTNPMPNQSYGVGAAIAYDGDMVWSNVSAPGFVQVDFVWSPTSNLNGAVILDSESAHIYNYSCTSPLPACASGTADWKDAGTLTASQ